MPRPLKYTPDYAVPPGTTLKEILDEKGISQSDLAIRAEMAEKTISQIINGVAPITYETAEKFEFALGVPATFWNQREMNYREALTRIEATARLAEDVQWLKDVPVKELKNRGYIDPNAKKEALLRSVLKFFGVSSVEAWQRAWGKPAAQYRGKKSAERRPVNVAAWLRMGELQAEKLPCAPYDPTRFRESLREIRQYADQDATAWYPAMVRLCAAAGVAVVFVPQIPGASVSGATKWIHKDKALIILSLKYKTDDHFWFTFFHEAAHILLHGKKLVFIDDESMSSDEQEVEADSAARNALIPASRAGELRHLRGSLAIRTFARSIGVSPGIVVGRMQRDRLLPQKFLNDLKVRLKLPQAEDPNRA